MSTKTQAAKPPMSARKLVVLLMGASLVGCIAGAMFAGAPAHSTPAPKAGYSLVMEVTVGGDTDEYVLDTGMRAGQCARAERGIRPMFRTYEGVRIATTYACTK